MPAAPAPHIVAAGLVEHTRLFAIGARRALQNVAVFTWIIITICGTIVTARWRERVGARLGLHDRAMGFGLAWAGLGWRRYAEPMWLTIPPCPPSAHRAELSTGQHGWCTSSGIATAAVAMAASVRMRNTALLALGTLGMFSYVTSAWLATSMSRPGCPRHCRSPEP